MFVHFKLSTSRENKVLRLSEMSIKASDFIERVRKLENLREHAFDLLVTDQYVHRSYSGDDLIPKQLPMNVEVLPHFDVQPHFDVHILLCTICKNVYKNAMTGKCCHVSYCKLCLEEERFFSQHCPECGEPNAKFEEDEKLRGFVQQWLTSIRQQTESPTNVSHHPNGTDQLRKMAKETTPNFEQQQSSLPICPICSEVMTDALIMPCCRSRFCIDCVNQQFLHSENPNCPRRHCVDKPIDIHKIVQCSSISVNFSGRFDTFVPPKNEEIVVQFVGAKIANDVVNGEHPDSHA